MKTNKKIKNLLCYIVAFMLAIVANLGFAQFSKPNSLVYAANSSTLTVKNSNFSSKDSDSQPKEFNPSSDDTSVDAKVVNTTDKDITSKFENVYNSLNKDNCALMIDAGNNVSTFGYTTKDEITIKKDSIYMISANVYTANGGSASLELISNEKVISSHSHIVSNNKWNRYYLFVKNNDIEEVKVNLGLYLKNSSGAVLFDNISAKQINDNELNSYILNPEFTSDRYNYTNLSDNLVKEYNIQDVTFLQKHAANSNLTTSGTVLDTDGEHEYAFKIVNSSSSYTTFETTSFSSTDKYIEFNQNSVYKVSVNVKAENLEGKATLKLLQVVDGNEKTVDASIDISKNTAETGNISNDYKTYSFYVQSSPSEIAKYKLAVEFGTQENLAAGSIYLSNIEITSVTTAIYTSGSSDSNGKQIDLTSNYSEHTTLLKNGKFDLISVGNYSNQYPATPNSWSVATGENTQYYGVINTSSTEFAKLPSSINATNPGGTNGEADLNNNVLMLHNTKADTLSYTSTAKTSLAAKSVHKFQALVQTQNGPATLSLITKKDGKEVVLSTLTINTEYEWEEVEMFVKVGYQATDISLKITLDSESSATAFVDDVRMDYYPAPTEELFNSISASRLVSKVDLTQILSENTDEFMFSGNSETDVEVKMVKISTDPINYAIAMNAYLSENYHKLTSNLGFKLNSGTKYKISVDVKTNLISTEKENIDLEKLGAGLKLSSFEETFTAIQTNDEWTTYTFYINPDSSTTTYLELMLGEKDYVLTGNAYFANIEFVEEVSETEFNAAKDGDTTKILSKTIVEDEETEEETKEDEEKPEINWFYFASSMIFAVAIVICVVGVMLKKVKFKKPTKKSKNEYDRNKTVSKQYYMRKATTLREEKIRELEKDLETLHNERVEFEENYKKDLVKLRQLKIKRASATEIKQLEKDMKKNQKLSASIGLTINKAQQDLDYAKTDAYLQSLVRKLSTQAQDKQQDKQ